MSWLMLAVGLVIISFCFVVFFGAPYLPTLKPQVKAALDASDLKPGDHLLELGCGDGKVLIAAAERGIRVTGYELNPLLVVVCWLRTRRFGNLVTVRWADFWHRTWPPADAVFTFLLPKYMVKLDTKIITYTAAQEGRVRLISFAFAVPGRTPVLNHDGIYVYDYSAKG